MISEAASPIGKAASIVILTSEPGLIGNETRPWLTPINGEFC